MTSSLDRVNMMYNNQEVTVASKCHLETFIWFWFFFYTALMESTTRLWEDIGFCMYIYHGTAFILFLFPQHSPDDLINTNTCPYFQNSLILFSPLGSIVCHQSREEIQKTTYGLYNLYEKCVSLWSLQRNASNCR